MLNVVGLLLLTGSLAHAEPSTQAARPQACADDNGGITLPPGFCATVFADNIGHARQMAVAPNGVLYVNTWSGRYYRNDTPPAGGFLVALQDTNGDGRADVSVRFGETRDQGSAGGTGIALYNGAVYAEVNDRIVRYALPAGAVAPNGPPEVVVSGLPLTGDHPMHPFRIDAHGNLYVDLGSATNSCQVGNRMPNSPGIQPCTELETRAGIWRYDANRTEQRFSPAERFATGLRNGEGIAFDSAGRIFATQHGRDQLRENWPSLYSPQQGADEPAEELVQLEQGADYGWPYCYFDLTQHKLVLAPEYGGDGRMVGLCADKRAPVAAFPAHWAPNDLLLYGGRQFPVGYSGGAFIAFHGSWNWAPSPQGGYNVVFQPFADGKPSGNYVVFADGFAGAIEEPGQAAHRPSGLAMGPDGALYISDDQRGRIGGSPIAVRRGQPSRPPPHLSNAPARRRPQWSRLKVRTRTQVRRRRSCGRRPEQRPPRSRSAAGSSTARWRAHPARGATARMPRGRRRGPISPAANGCGAMAASLQSARPLPMGWRYRRSTVLRCRPWAAPSSRNPSSPLSPPMYGRWAIRTGLDAAGCGGARRATAYL